MGDPKKKAFGTFAKSTKSYFVKMYIKTPPERGSTLLLERRIKESNMTTDEYAITNRL